MSYPAKTLFVFGCYLVVLGCVLVLVPDWLLGLFQIPATPDVWIRVVGMLVLILGVYDMVAAHAELRPFMVWSVPLRASVIFFFAAFVSAGLAPPVLMLFGAVDLACGLWTWRALRCETDLSGRLP